MSRLTAERHTETKARGKRHSPTLRIDDDTFEALSIADQTPYGDSLRILRWLETWSGDDR